MTEPVLPPGPFLGSELERAGMTPWQLQSAVRDRAIRRMLRNVYVDAALPDTIELRAKAASLVVADHAVACDRTAAWLHGVDLRTYRELDVPAPLDLWALRGSKRVIRAGCVGGERDLAGWDICRVGGVQVTTPLRTALDLGCRLRRYEALAAIEMIMRALGVTREGLERELPRYRGRRGVLQLRQLINLCDARAESSGESWVRLAIHDAGLPAPEPQYWVTENGMQIFRLDHAYPHARVAVEYDGQEFHSTAAQQDADRRRREWLTERGWTVIVVDRLGLSAEGRRPWLAQLRSALGLVA